MVARVPLAVSQTDYYAAFEFPQNESALCKTVNRSTGCFPSTPPPPTPTPVPPTPTPIPAPTMVSPTNLTLYVNGKYYTEQQTFNQPLEVPVGTQLLLQVVWNGPPLDGTGDWISIEDGGTGPDLHTCYTGKICQIYDQRASPIRGCAYQAKLHYPNEYWLESINIVFVNWV